MAATGWLAQALHSHSLHKQLLHGARDKDCGEGRVAMSPVLQLREMDIKPVGMSGITDLMLPAVVEGDPARGLGRSAS